MIAKIRVMHANDVLHAVYGYGWPQTRNDHGKTGDEAHAVDIRLDCTGGRNPMTDC